jgi:hypothetical protein
MRQPGTISHRRHGFHRNNYLAGKAQPGATGKSRTSAGSAVPGNPAVASASQIIHQVIGQDARVDVDHAVLSGSRCTPARLHPASRACCADASFIPARTDRHQRADRSVVFGYVLYGRLRRLRWAAHKRKDASTRDDNHAHPTPRHLEPPRLPWRLTLVALGFSASAAIGEPVDVTGSGHYSATSDLEVTGDDLFPGGTRPAAGCWKMLENGRSQAGR